MLETASVGDNFEADFLSADFCLLNGLNGDIKTTTVMVKMATNSSAVSAVRHQHTKSVQNFDILIFF